MRNNDSFIIELRNIKKVYGTKKVLDDVNLFIKKGDFAVIRGKSGSGKSTLLNIIGLLEKSDLGEYYFDGKRIEDKSTFEMDSLRANSIGFIFQSYNLIEYLSVWDNITMPFLYSNYSLNSEKVKYIREMMEIFDIDDLAKKQVNLLSGGEKQRVAIARAIAKKPELIIADEPTGNLDKKNSQIIEKYLRNICKLGITVIIVTHSVDEFIDANQSYYLKEGKLC